MPKGRPKKDNQSDSEELQDIMAWGNKKDNFYKDSQEEDSDLSEEQLEAKKIYDNHFQEIQNEQFYDLPADQQQPDDNMEENVEEDKQLSHEYFTKQIKRMVKMGLQVSEQRQGQVKDLLETYIQTYLMSLISLRELDIPYIEHHPILNHILQLKQDIKQLKIAFDQATRKAETRSSKDEQSEDLQEEFNEQNDGQDDDEQEDRQINPQLQEGMKIYEQAKNKVQQQKKTNKKNKQRQRQAKQKPAFLQVKGNQGRLANQKILKNKGLVKKRKKIDRNGRVKLRRKFDKATSKRRAQGHFVRENPGRQYQGQKNIKTGKIASVKIK